MAFDRSKRPVGLEIEGKGINFLWSKVCIPISSSQFCTIMAFGYGCGVSRPMITKVRSRALRIFEYQVTG